MGYNRLKRRLTRLRMIPNGSTIGDKLKLTILSLILLLPNKITGLNKKTPEPLINLSKSLRINLNGTIWSIDHPRQLYLISDEYEKGISTWFNRSGETFIDIGANIGKYSIKLAPNFKQIYAFEPIPETYRILRRNIIKNNLNNIKAYDKAIWKENITLTFHIKDYPSFNSAKMANGSINRIDVKAITLDSMINQFTKVDLIKIDVEGAEYEALQGMAKILDKNHPDIIIEILEENQEKVHNLLSEHGYILEKKNIIYHLYTHKEANSH